MRSTKYIIKLRGLTGAEDVMDICTNKKMSYEKVIGMTTKTDTIIFKESSLFDKLPRHKFNYVNVVNFLNCLSHQQSLEMDLYRFIDEYEKILVSTIVIQKWI